MIGECGEHFGGGIKGDFQIAQRGKRGICFIKFSHFVPEI